MLVVSLLCRSKIGHNLFIGLILSDLTFQIVQLDLINVSFKIVKVIKINLHKLK